MTSAERIAAAEHIISELPDSPTVLTIGQVTWMLGYRVTEIGWPYLERSIARAANEKARRARENIQGRAA